MHLCLRLVGAGLPSWPRFSICIILEDSWACWCRRVCTGLLVLVLHRPVHRIWDSEAGAGCLSLSARHLRGVLRAVTPRGPQTLGFLQSGKAAGEAGGAGGAGDQGAVCFDFSHPRPSSARGEKRRGVRPSSGGTP